MTARVCPKHGKPFPCGKCRIENAQKPGPKPKYGIAMTPAERQRQSRANRRAKQDDAERRNLIAELMKIYRRQQSDSLSSVAFAVVDRKQRAQYHKDLKGLSVAELRVAMEGKQTPDSHGRLHDERSGEKERTGGQSEIEKILGAKQHDSSYFEDEDQDPSMAAGFRVNPVGTAPESFEAEDKTADSADAALPGSAKPEFSQTTEEKWRDKAIDSLVHKMFSASITEAAKCPFCDETFLSKVGAENHLAEQYVKGEKDLISFFDFTWALQQMRMNGSMPPGGVFEDSKPRGLPYLHHVSIQEEMALVKKQSRRKRAA